MIRKALATISRHAGPALAAALLLAPGSSVAPLAQAAQGTDVQRSVLSTGLTVLTERRPESRVVGIVIAVRAGSRYEDEGTDSAAHMFEHMSLQGTAARPSRESLLRPITGRGGTLNVSAGWELMFFESSMRADDLDVALDVLADILQGSLFEADKLDKEREIILQELDEIQDDPSTLADHTFWSGLFEGQDLGRLPSGSFEGTELITRDSLLEFRSRWIGANRSAIAVVGPFEHADIERRVAARFAGYAPVSAPPTVPADLATTGTGRLDISAGSQQAEVVMGVPIPGATHGDRYALTVLQSVLGGFTGRLTREIREERGLAYSARAGIRVSAEAGSFTVSAGTEPSNVQEVLGLLEQELVRMALEPVTEAELQRAIGYAIGSRVLRDEAAASRAATLAGAAALGTFESLPEFEARVAALRVEDIQRVARDYFRPERLLRVVLSP